MEEFLFWLLQHFANNIIPRDVQSGNTEGVPPFNMSYVKSNLILSDSNIIFNLNLIRPNTISKDYKSNNKGETNAMSRENVSTLEKCLLDYVDAMTINERIQIFKKHDIINKDYTRLVDWINTKGLIKEKNIEEMLKIENISKEEFNIAFKELDTEEKEAIVGEVHESNWYSCFKKIMDLYQKDGKIMSENITVYDLSYSLSPFVFLAGKELSDVINSLKNIVVGNAVLQNILDKIAASLIGIASKTLIWELHNFKENNVIDGESPEERFKDFINKKFANHEELLKFYSTYPVIARRVTIKCNFIVRHFKEMLTRLDGELFNILRELNLPLDCRAITALSCDQGDTHQQGRFVIKIVLEGKVNLIYKPRNLRIQEKFEKFVQWFNDNSGLLDLKVNKAFYQDNYTFESFVEYNECISEEQVTNFYERFGEICALMYILRGNDIHYENIIASSEYPVIIDIETLFQHQSDLLNFNEDADAKAFKECIDSVAGTGLLPIIAFVNGKNKKGIDISGLNGDSQKLPYKLLGIIDANTDSMRYEYQEFTIQGANNIPMLNGEKVSFRKYIPVIIKGFEKALEFVFTNKNAFVMDNGVLSIFKGTLVRHLLKATQNYGKLMEFSSHPNYTKDMVKMERLFNNAWGYNYRDKRNVKYEVRDMLNDDIPIFYGLVDSKDMLTSTGEVIKDYFAASAYDKVLDRINELTKSEVQKQIAHMKVTMGMFEELCENKFEVSRAKEYEVEKLDILGEHREMLINEASQIAELIMKECIWDKNKETLTWNNVLYDDINLYWKVKPLDDSLYQGLSGIALFLYYLDSVTNNDKYAETVDKLLKVILGRPLVNNAISAYYSTVSVLYPLTVMYMKSKDSDKLQHIFNITKFIDENVDYIQFNDWISGHAGIVKLMANLYDITKDQLFLNVGEKCCSKILNSINLSDVSSLKTGMAHGLSGIAAALNEFNKIKKSAELKEYIKVLMTLEEEILSKKQECSLSWCNGHAGYALARLIMIDNWEKDKVNLEVKNIIMNYVSDVKDEDCLCHGNISELELLKKYYELTGDEEVKEKLDYKISSMLKRKQQNGGYGIYTIEGYNTAGMFLGLSGIGYEMLRLYDSKKVPDVLALEV